MGNEERMSFTLKHTSASKFNFFRILVRQKQLLAIDLIINFFQIIINMISHLMYSEVWIFILFCPSITFCEFSGQKEHVTNGFLQTEEIAVLAIRTVITHIVEDAISFQAGCVITA